MQLRTVGRSFSNILVLGSIGILLFSYALLIWNNRSGTYNNDSWAYYELSQTVFGDFFRFTTWRSYYDTSPYSTAFPPLWPVLIALWNRLFHQGMSGALWLSALSLAGFFAASEWAGRRLFKRRWIGLAAAALSLIDRTLIGEVVAGKSIPLELVFLAIGLGLLSSGKAMTRGEAVLAGAVMGLAVMQRFDGLIPAVVIGIGILAMTRRVVVAACYGAACLLLMSPWIACSMLLHGTLFATDNRLVAIAVHNIQILDFYPIPPPTLREFPGLWLSKVASNIAWMIRDLRSIPKIIPVLMILAVGALAYRYWRDRVTLRAALHHPLLAVLVVFGLALAAQCSSYLATGYIDFRYFAAHRWFATFVALGTIDLAMARYWRSITLVILPIAVTLGVASAWAHAPYVDASETRSTIETVHGIRACVDLASHPVMLVLGDQLAAPLGAETGVRAAQGPSTFDQLDPAGRELFLRRFGITHIYTRGVIPSLGRDIVAKRVSGCKAPIWNLEMPRGGAAV